MGYRLRYTLYAIGAETHEIPMNKNYRTDIGLEPACVVVCPEHAIIAGDMNDPSSEISHLLARHDVTVANPNRGAGERGAGENDRRSRQGLPWAGPIHLGGTMAEQMVQVAYNAQHRIPWHWPVPAYLVTKSWQASSACLTPAKWRPGQPTRFEAAVTGTISGGGVSF